jgi:hypothetical protein
MSRQFLTPVQLPAGTANPSVGGLGALFFRTDLGQLVIHDGSDWLPVGPGSTTSSVDGGTPVGYVDVLDGGTASTITFSAVYDGGNASSF